MKATFFISLAAATVLAACGGGSGESVEPLDVVVPDTASASGEAYLSYAKRQIDLDATRPRDEPLSVDAVDAPPTSETDEPVSLD